MNSDPADGTSIVKDGLSGSARPLPREPGAAPGTGSGTGTGTGNDSAPDASGSSARDGIEGLNKAAGPAEESDDLVEDRRALTTDVSPSD